MKACEACGQEFPRRLYPCGSHETWTRYRKHKLCWECRTRRTCALDGCDQEFHMVAGSFGQRYCGRRCAKRAEYARRGKTPLVPVEPFRQRVEEAQIPMSVVALRLGWLDRGQPDSSRVKRTLGMKPYHASRGYGPRHRELVTSRMAEQLCDVLGIGPHELEDL